MSLGSLSPGRYSIDMSRGWAGLQPPLIPDLINAVEDGFKFGQATPVQAAAVPLLLGNKDVVVEAVTGSGKTLAFLLPLLHILADPKKRSSCMRDKGKIGAVVLCPTRELASQSFATLQSLLAFCPSVPLKGLLLTGGSTSSLEEDLKRFRTVGCNIIVATPGRLEELIRTHGEEFAAALRDAFEFLVLDEADRLLDMGFEVSIREILTKLPKQRRTGLFSATMTEGLGDLIKSGLRNPVRVTVKVQESDSSIRVPTELGIQYAMIGSHESKLASLLQLLSSDDSPMARKKIIVYAATCACVDFYSLALPLLLKPAVKAQVKLLALHGKLPQNKRTAVCEGFKTASVEDGSVVLLCTDVAARGLDFPDVDWVVQLDPPQDPKSFLHRCGRTARNGRTGNALVFLQPNEEAYVELLRNRGVPMAEWNRQLASDAEAARSMVMELRGLSLKNRDIYDAGTRAVVSYVRYYQEHHAKYIFRLKELSVPSLANAFGLLRLPIMPEFRTVFTKQDLQAFEATVHDPATIAYPNKQKELARLARLEKTAAEKAASQPAEKKRRSNEPWSEKKARTQARQERQLKKARKAEAKERALLATVREDDSADELAELQDDYRAMMREKRTKK